MQIVNAGAPGSASSQAATWHGQLSPARRQHGRGNHDRKRESHGGNHMQERTFGVEVADAAL
jgi:hypothetical protein